LQDHIVSNVCDSVSIPGLARIARMSPRTMTRTFRAATGLSTVSFAKKVRLEAARIMLNDPDVTLQTVAERAGFRSARHSRRTWRQAFGLTPSMARSG
jgi:transcriptional regulator GlxA family with amidase domain